MAHGVNSKRGLDDLALMYEHLVKDNGNSDVLAASFRGISTEDETFLNGIRIGIVYGYVHSAIKHLIESDKLSIEKKDCAQQALDALLKERSFQSIVDAVNILADAFLIF